MLSSAECSDAADRRRCLLEGGGLGGVPAQVGVGGAAALLGAGRRPRVRGLAPRWGGRAALIVALRVLFLLVLCQAPHLQRLRRLEEGGQLIVGDIHLAVVHKVQDGGEVGEGDILQEHYRMLTRVTF